MILFQFLLQNVHKVLTKTLLTIIFLLQEPVNPWSKKSTIDWGNSSLPVEDSYSSTPVWSTGIDNNHSAEVNNHVNNDVTSHVTEPAQDNGWGEQPPVEMKDQTTVSFGNYSSKQAVF